MQSIQLNRDLDYVCLENNDKSPLCTISRQELSDKEYRSNNIALSIFHEKDLFLEETNNELSIELAGTGSKLMPIANNQKSLLVIETYFLTKSLSQINSDKKVICVYIGGAPGDHISIIGEMFPMVIFHVYDPVEMKCKETSNVRIHQEYFTDETVDLVLSVKNLETEVLFISDMRNKDYLADPKTNKQLTDNAQMILSDMETQNRWFQKIKPAFGLLRFRPLLQQEAKILEHKGVFEYPTGVHLSLPFAKPKNNSSFLMTNTQSIGTYYTNDVLNGIKYHNIVIRNSNVYLNPFTRNFDSLINSNHIEEWLSLDPSRKLDKGVSHYVMNSGWDSRATLFVFCIYLKTIRKVFPTHAIVTDFILTNFSRLENSVVEPETIAMTT
jgi:hypothetical protein